MGFAYLDIETSWEQSITVIGIYKSDEGMTQLVAPDIGRERLLEVLEGVEMLFTYNGARFDLPVITRHFGVRLEDRWPHRDLMYDCWKNNLRGGLKGVERRLGIHRDSEGLNGMDAMRLWSHHRRHPKDAETWEEFCCEALGTLLRYNRDDCENLEILASKLGIVPAPANAPVRRYRPVR